MLCHGQNIEAPAGNKGLFFCSAEGMQEPTQTPRLSAHQGAEGERPNNHLHQRRANMGAMPSYANTAGDLASIPLSSRERSGPGEPAGCRFALTSDGISRDFKRQPRRHCGPTAGHTRPEQGLSFLPLAPPPSSASIPPTGAAGAPPTRGEQPRGDAPKADGQPPRPRKSGHFW